MRDYVEVAYKAQEKPFGEYPLQLAAYLMERYDLKPGMSILDNGCGRGEFLHAFSNLGMEVQGTDLSSYCASAKIVDLNEERLPFSNNSFDAVFSKSVIEHISNTNHYMTEIYRVLKPGGRLILMAPDWESQYKVFYSDPTHIHPYTLKSFERLMQMHGFNNVEAEKFTQLPYTWYNPFARGLSHALRILGPVKKIYKNKFFRFSRELMVLGSGTK